MAVWYPGAVRQHVGRFKVPMRNPKRINYHTAVTNAATLFHYFRVWGRPCSHFYIGKTGIIYQFIAINIRAAADLQGNPDTISIETWDGYPNGWPGYWKNNGDVPPWNGAQMKALVRLTRWIQAQTGISNSLASNSRPGSTSHGLSYHRLGIAPYRISGGLVYSNARGKICPAPRRISQIPSVRGGKATPPKPVAPPKPVRDPFEIQLALAIMGYYDEGPGLKYLDGKYETATVKAVTAYQKGKKGLASDGDWGKATDDYYVRHDMSKIEDKLANLPWTYRRTGIENNAYAYLIHTKRHVATIEAQMTGLLKALDQLVGGEGVDLKAVAKAAEEGAARAFVTDDLADALIEALAESLPEQEADKIATAVVNRIGAQLTTNA